MNQEGSLYWAMLAPQSWTSQPAELVEINYPVSGIFVIAAPKWTKKTQNAINVESLFRVRETWSQNHLCHLLQVIS